MASYGGRTFSVIQQQGMLPQWVQMPNVAVRHYAGGNRDNIQYAGRGNYRLDVLALDQTSGATAAWQALVSNTARTLTDLWGDTYTNVYLVEVGAARWNGADNFYEIPLVFMRSGA